MTKKFLLEFVINKNNEDQDNFIEIKTSEDFEICTEVFVANKNHMSDIKLIFRGHSNYNSNNDPNPWKLNSSWRRMIKPQLNNSLTEEKEIVKSNELFCKFLDNHIGNINNYKIKITAEYQHHGFPTVTPFIDFTSDFNVALGFAIENYFLWDPVPNYLSIYFIDIHKNNNFEVVDINLNINQYNAEVEGLFDELLDRKNKKKSYIKYTNNKNNRASMQNSCFIPDKFTEKEYHNLNLKEIRLVLTDDKLLTGILNYLSNTPVNLEKLFPDNKGTYLNAFRKTILWHKEKNNITSSNYQLEKQMKNFLEIINNNTKKTTEITKEKNKIICKHDNYNSVLDCNICKKIQLCD